MRMAYHKPVAPSNAEVFIFTMNVVNSFKKPIASTDRLKDN